MQYVSWTDGNVTLNDQGNLGGSLTSDLSPNQRVNMHLNYSQVNSFQGDDVTN